MRILPNWLGSTQRNSRCRAVKPLLRTTRYGGNIKDLKNRIIWRQARHTPPHCLACGTADITLVDYEAINGSELISTNFRHSCGGALVIDYKDDPGIRFFEFDESVVWMDIDGNRLDVSEETDEGAEVYDVPEFLIAEK